jgi:hypothetical protein
MLNFYGLTAARVVAIGQSSALFEARQAFVETA